MILEVGAVGEGACHQKLRSVLLGARPGKLWVCWKVPEAREAQEEARGWLQGAGFGAGRYLLPRSGCPRFHKREVRTFAGVLPSIRDLSLL